MFDLSKKISTLVLLWLTSIEQVVWCEIEENTINEDGSFSFRHKNDDIGGFYHSATGSPDNNVRGRYGSRNPATGQVEEVVYSAGPRGFRANGPKIHRKMDLAQYPVLPRGSPDDPLADPFDDPTYSFRFRTPDQSRSEDNDATGRVRGLYSYLDDVGERHTVRYAAGAGTGFEVSNAIPDNPVLVNYEAALYKAPPQTRGKMSVQRGPNGSYKLIAAGPDQRRAESRNTDGLVRGTYSYLDDKGVQRTVEYIAGAGIGYRVIQSSVGSGTHINPSVSDFRLTDADFKLANEFGQGGSGGLGISTVGRRPGSDGEYLQSPGSVGYESNADDSSSTGYDNRVKAGLDENFGSSVRNMGTTPGRRGGTRFGGAIGGSMNRDSSIDELSSAGGSKYLPPANGSSVRGGIQPTGNRNTIASERRASGATNRNGDRTRDRNRDRVSTSSGGSRINLDISSSSSGAYLPRDKSGNGYRIGSHTSAADNYNLNDDDVAVLPPLITANRKILEIDRERDWVDRHRDSTIIKNVGKWYIGLPPGQGVRAHVQNIDILPLGGRRLPSPSEALRQDEIADMEASLDAAGGTPYRKS